MLFKAFYLGGEIKGVDDKWYFYSSDGSRYNMTDNDVRDIYFFNEIWFPSHYLRYMGDSGVALHFLKHGFYQTTYLPAMGHGRWPIYKKQLEAYKNNDKRLSIAKAFVMSEIVSAQIVFPHIDMSDIINKLNIASEIPSVMAAEAEAMKRYWHEWHVRVPEFTGRQFNPSPDKYNAIVSLAYAYLYGTAFSAIKMTGLDPRIGYLHENRFRTNTLHLDVADMYKPIVASFAMKLAMKWKDNMFYRLGKGIYLSDKGMQKFTEYWDDLLRSRGRWCNRLSFVVMIAKDVRELRGYIMQGNRPFESCIVRERR